MKYTKILCAVALLVSSGNVFAEFFEGFDNGSGVGQTSGTAQGTTNADAQGYGTGIGDVSGQGSGRGNADGQVDFAVTFKGKVSTDMTSDIYGSGQDNTNASLYGYTNAYGSGYNNWYGYSNAYTNSAPWNYYNPGYSTLYYAPNYGYNPTMTGYVYPAATLAPSFSQVQQQMRQSTTPAPAN